MTRPWKNIKIIVTADCFKMPVLVDIILNIYGIIRRFHLQVTKLSLHSKTRLPRN